MIKASLIIFVCVVITAYYFVHSVNANAELLFKRDTLQVIFIWVPKDYGNLLVGARFVSFGTFEQVRDFTSVNKSFVVLYTMTFEFFPTQKAILDRAFNLSVYCTPWSNEFILRFIDLKGFDVISARLFEFEYVIAKSQPTVYVYYSSLKLFKNNRQLDASECTGELFKLNNTKRHPINLFEYLFLTGVKYYRNTCKLVFANAKIFRLTLSEMSDTYVKSNMLTFDQRTRYATIGSSISRLIVDMYCGKLSTSLMDENVFEKVRVLYFYGRIDCIEANTFAKLANVMFIKLIVTNTRELFAQGLHWIEGLNDNFNRNCSNLTAFYDEMFSKNTTNYVAILTFSKYVREIETEKIINKVKAYSYPDEDFCLFAQFPFHRLVFLNPHTVCVNGNCSCTQYWLLKYVHYLTRTKARQLLAREEPFQFINYKNESVKKCDFKKLMSKCDSKSFSSPANDNNPASILDEMFYASVAEFILTILIPVWSIVGIVMNILNIKVILGIELNTKTDEIKQKIIFKFMISYSIINLIYCVIHILYLMNKCSDEAGIFCSSIYRTRVVQYYKIIFVEYLGNVLKILSNLNYMAISVNRYVLLEKESKLTALFSKTIYKLKKKAKCMLILFMTILTMALNVHYLIIYKIITKSLIAILIINNVHYFMSFPFSLSNSQVYDYQSYESTSSIQTRAEWYVVLFIVNFILFDLVLFVAFTGTDILLVKSLRNIVNQKKMAFDRKSSAQQDQIIQIENSEKTILKSVIVNIVILSIIKVFDLSMSVSKFFVWRTNLKDNFTFVSKLNSFCFTMKICMVYDDIVKLLYLISFCYSTILFANFNKKFSEKLTSFFPKISKKRNTSKKVIHQLTQVFTLSDLKSL